MKEKGYLQREYPFIEYWRGCTIHSQDRRLSRPLHVDHPDSKQRQGSEGSKMSTKKISEVASSKAKAKEVSDSSHAVTDSNNEASNGSNLRGGGGHSQSEEVYTVKFTVATVSKGQGDVVLEMHPDWAPVGAARFAELVKAGTFTNARFFRVIKGFMAQFGIPALPRFFEGRGDDENGNEKGANHHGLPSDAASVDWKALKSSIHDEDKTTAKIQSNTRGMLTFAHAGKDTRGHQLFINTADNVYLDKEGFPPIGRVVAGMEYVDALYSAYGEGGKGDGTYSVTLLFFLLSLFVRDVSVSLYRFTTA
jgi:cyclophilin family peptidyl-prolyl cis-trans isomerase